MSEPKEQEAETTWSRSRSQFKGKQNSEYFDPCQEAADKSLRCLRRNGGDRTLCQDCFDAYRACKKSWMAEMTKERKAKTGGPF
ncbi:hypothetical protein MRB53_040144 [Persea americana]|nr:hypothetical protein MRB53_040144 [Persea americana]